MRPERLSYEMEKAFNVWFETKSVNGFKKLLPELKRVYRKYAKENDDYRSGFDTYGYDGVNLAMAYISDRWNCSFRIRWLIDGLEAGLIK